MLDWFRVRYFLRFLGKAFMMASSLANSAMWATMIYGWQGVIDTPSDYYLLNRHN